VLRLAREEAGQLKTAWRLKYNYGPSDARYTSMTETGILFDLLVLREHDRLVNRAADPTAALDEAMQDEEFAEDAFARAESSALAVEVTPPSWAGDDSRTGTVSYTDEG